MLEQDDSRADEQISTKSRRVWDNLPTELYMFRAANKAVALLAWPSQHDTYFCVRHAVSKLAKDAHAHLRFMTSFI